MSISENDSSANPASFGGMAFPHATIGNIRPSTRIPEMLLVFRFLHSLMEADVYH